MQEVMAWLDEMHAIDTEWAEVEFGKSEKKAASFAMFEVLQERLRDYPAYYSVDQSPLPGFLEDGSSANVFHLVFSNPDSIHESVEGLPQQLVRHHVLKCGE